MAPARDRSRWASEDWESFLEYIAGEFKRGRTVHLLPSEFIRLLEELQEPARFDVYAIHDGSELGVRYRGKS